MPDLPVSLLLILAKGSFTFRDFRHLPVVQFLAVVLGGGGAIWLFYQWITKVNSAGQARFEYAPISGWTVAGTFGAMILVLLGIAGENSRSGVGPNSVIGCLLGLGLFLSILVRIAKQSSTKLALASIIPLLVLAALFVGVLFAIYASLTSRTERRRQNDVSNSLDRMFGN